MNLYKKFNAKPYYFSVTDTTLSLDNHLRLRRNILGRIKNLIMIIDYKIRDEKLQHSINREVGKLSALASGNVNKININILHLKK